MNPSLAIPVVVNSGVFRDGIVADPELVTKPFKEGVGDIPLWYRTGEKEPRFRRDLEWRHRGVVVILE